MSFNSRKKRTDSNGTGVPAAKTTTTKTRY